MPAGQADWPPNAERGTSRIHWAHPGVASMSNSIAVTVDQVETLLANGRAADAIAVLESETNLHPDSFEIWYCLGRGHGQIGRHVEAERAFRNAVRLRPDRYEAHYNLALSLAHQERLRDSIDYFLSARRINPHIPNLNKTLFVILATILQDGGGSDPSLKRDFSPLIERPLVSVITPTQNRPRLLQDALNSVRRQSYQDWEVIVVNDGGGDVSPVVESMPGDMREQFVQIDLPTTRGQAAARNVAIRAAKGDVLAFLDDDDLYSPSHLQTLVSGLRVSNAGIAFTATELVQEMILDGKRVELERTPFCPGLKYSRPLLLVRNFIPINTWGVRRECFDAFGVFDEALHCLEDWDFLLRISPYVDIHQMQDVTVEYRMTNLANDSVSKRYPHMQAVKSLHRRYEAHGLELVQLARELYLETLA